jgi:hypothetical protein
MEPGMNTSLIFIHKQSTSGRVRFLRFPHGVVGLEPLPAASSVADGDVPNVSTHPVEALKQAAEMLGIPLEQMNAEGEFQAWVDTSDGPRQVLLVSFSTIDPPFAAAEAHGCRFIAMTEARGLPQIELALMRKIYEYVLG